MYLGKNRMRFQNEQGYAVPEDTLIKAYEASPEFGDKVTFLEWLKRQKFVLPKPSEAR